MKKLSLVAVAAMLSTALPLGAATAQVPEGEITDLPFLSRETPRGSGDAVSAPGPAATTKTADGDISDWVGIPSRYGGTAVYSAGEFVYQDHLFDAHGPDDGRDAARFEVTDPVEGFVPQAYRLDALAQADLSGELSLPIPSQFAYDDSYGDATSHQDRSDLHELRVAVSGDDLALLARTTTMTAASDTALLVVADTVPGSGTYDVPFGSGISTDVADVALFVANGTVLVADLASGAVGPLEGATATAAPDAWNNALETTFPLATVAGQDGSLSLAVATGKPNDAGDGFAPLTLEQNNATPHANVANVAFRFGEPVRIWLEKDQALSLGRGTIDPFFKSLDVVAMRDGASQTYVPGAGYHDRIFESPVSTGVPQEGGRNGIFQHYGVYLPESYEGKPTPLQWWLHWRGGNAHTGAAIVPKIFKQYGEDRDAIVVSPSGRGTSTWYVGRGHVDFLQVWADVTESFAIDRDRVYVTGHSMGGWGSYLLTLLYPDRFAGAAPVAGPVTQGAWVGCDSSSCYISANESRPVDQHTRKILENARHIPYAILHGTSDELVPYSGVARQAERLAQLGYRFRFYTYPGYEHYSHPIMDQWAEAASYIQSFTRPKNPARVTYKRDMLFEIATEQVQSGGATLNFDFDSAYWMSGLTPVDPAKGVASFDGRSLAIPEDPYLTAPDTGPPTAPGQTGPYVITGLQWVDDPTKSAAAPTNAFSATLSGASAVRLDLGRMAIATAESIAGSVTTGAALDLSLDGDWATAPTVLIDNQPTEVRFADGVATVAVPSGTHNLTITPGRKLSTTTLTVSGRGSKRTLSATVRDADSSAPLAGVTVTFTANGTEIGTATTNDDGVATLDAPPGWRGNDITFTATFGGNDLFVGSSDSRRV